MEGKIRKYLSDLEKVMWEFCLQRQRLFDRSDIEELQVLLDRELEKYQSRKNV